MKIGITGATGFIGRHFIRYAQGAGHEVVAYSRNPHGLPVLLASKTLRQLASAPHELPETRLDALVHLAGESLMGLWTRSKCDRVWKSRVDYTQALVRHLRSWSPDNRPQSLVCASGTGFYGDRGVEELDETSSSGAGFLARLCVEWESAAKQAGEFGSRVVNLRTGMVLGADGAAFPLLRRVFGLGLGGRLGNGRQWMPWIHVEDAARLILSAVEDTRFRGPLNLVAPQAVTNAEFTQTLAQTLKRPAWFHVPALALRLVLRGMADEMLLGSQRVNPRVALESGYRFLHPTLPGCLAALLNQD
ncbi:MAG: TIGR01777 family oxidoreductase [Verrucomicrobiaceae bacterium]|nr:TIGR01777 family oxidoreductase [Verrucomicrobiaceae bacterium]